MSSNIISITNIHLFHMKSLKMGHVDIGEALPSFFLQSKNLNTVSLEANVSWESEPFVCVLRWIDHWSVCFVLSHYSGASPFIHSQRSSLYDHVGYTDTEKFQGFGLTRLCTKGSRNFSALQCCSIWTL